MSIPLPKSELESAYRLVAEIAECLLIYSSPVEQFDIRKGWPIPTPSKAESQFSAEVLLAHNGDKCLPSSSNGQVVPADLLDRLGDAISSLGEAEERAWAGRQED
jgi:hypothetical protein